MISGQLVSDGSRQFTIVPKAALADANLSEPGVGFSSAIFPSSARGIPRADGDA
jgi:hypothetical protein